MQATFDQSCIDALNEQICTEHAAWYTYLAIGAYFRKSDVGLLNVARWYEDRASEELDHARQLIEYQTMRGGTLKLQGVPVPCNDVQEFTPDNCRDIQRALVLALETETLVYNRLLHMHTVASTCNDHQFADFIEGNFLDEQVKDMYELKIEMAKLKNFPSDGHARWAYDQSKAK